MTWTTGKWDMKVDVLLIAVENYAKLFAVFVFWRLLRGCKENIHGFWGFLPGTVWCFRPPRVFWIPFYYNLKEELTFQLLNSSLNFHPCSPQQTCAPLGMFWKDLHMDFGGVGNSLQAGDWHRLWEKFLVEVERPNKTWQQGSNCKDWCHTMCLWLGFHCGFGSRPGRF